MVLPMNRKASFQINDIVVHSFLTPIHKQEYFQVLHDQYNATANIYDGELNIIQYPFVIFIKHLNIIFFFLAFLI